jgi:putative hydrolase of the HAD superfamily
LHLKITPNSVLVFDLDDTLFKEVEFLRSAFKEISSLLQKSCGINYYDKMLEWYSSGVDVFRNLEEECGNQMAPKKDLVQMYRQHSPDIILCPGAKIFLEVVRPVSKGLGIITDGRSITQRNKIRALELDQYFDDIIISEEFGSEKPSLANFQFYEDKYPLSDYFYFGDNVKKDFLAPNALGWNSICLLDDGKNIHHQNFDVESVLQPKMRVNSFSEIEIINEL